MTDLPRKQPPSPPSGGDLDAVIVGAGAEKRNDIVARGYDGFALA